MERGDESRNEFEGSGMIEAAPDAVLYYISDIANRSSHLPTVRSAEPEGRNAVFPDASYLS